MKATLSYHTGTTWNYAHNVDERARARESHIDPELIKENVILKSETLLEAYEKCFGDALRDYNAKQVEKGHAERQKGDVADYLKSLQKAYERERKTDTPTRHAIRPSYETIIQVGDMHAPIDRAKQKELLTDMFKRFEAENPNIYVFCAAIHADERTEDGRLSGIHMHVDYVPVAHDCKQGLSVQPVLNKALAEQGFTGTDKAHTAQMVWQEHMRGSLAEVAKAHGIEIEHKHENREHLDREKNRLLQQNREQRDLTDRLQAENDKLRAENERLSKKPLNAPQADKSILGRKYHSQESIKAYTDTANAILQEKDRERLDIKERLAGSEIRRTKLEKDIKAEHDEHIKLKDKWDDPRAVRIRLHELERQHGQEREHRRDLTPTR